MAKKDHPVEGNKEKAELENNDTSSASSFKDEEVDKEKVQSDIENLANQEVEVYKEEEDNKISTRITSSPLSLPIDELKTAEQLYTFGKILVGGSLCPFKKVEDVVIALIAGKELGISLTAALSGIHAIEGRASLGVHIKKGILLSKGVIFKKIRDCERIFNFVEPPSKERLAKDPDAKAKLVIKGFIDERPKGDNIKAIPTNNYVTRYIFTRYFNVGHKIVKNTAIGEFSVEDAINAGLTDKSNWKNYLKDMLASRAFTRGSNEIADDLLHGMYSYSELADLNDSVEYYIDKDGHEQIVSRD